MGAYAIFPLFALFSRLAGCRQVHRMGGVSDDAKVGGGWELAWCSSFGVAGLDHSRNDGVSSQCVAL